MSWIKRFCLDVLDYAAEEPYTFNINSACNDMDLSLLPTCAEDRMALLVEWKSWATETKWMPVESIEFFFQDVGDVPAPAWYRFAVDQLRE